MTVAEDALWALQQAGQRLERYVEDFLVQIDLVPFPPAPARKGWISPAHPRLRSSTYRPNGSDPLPKSKHLLILRSYTCVLSPVPPSAAKSRLSFSAKSRPLSVVKSRPPLVAHLSPKFVAPSRPQSVAKFMLPFATHLSPQSAAPARPPFATHFSPQSTAPERLPSAGKPRPPSTAHSTPPLSTDSSPPTEAHVPLAC